MRHNDVIVSFRGCCRGQWFLSPLVCGFKYSSSVTEAVWTGRAMRTAARTVTVVMLAMTQEVGRFHVLAVPALYSRQLHTQTPTLSTNSPAARFGATVSALTVSALGLFGTGR